MGNINNCLLAQHPLHDARSHWSVVGVLSGWDRVWPTVHVVSDPCSSKRQLSSTRAERSFSATRAQQPGFSHRTGRLPSTLTTTSGGTRKVVIELSCAPLQQGHRVKPVSAHDTIHALHAILPQESWTGPSKMLFAYCAYGCPTGRSWQKSQIWRGEVDCQGGVTEHPRPSSHYRRLEG